MSAYRLGNFEEAAMLSVLSLKENAYGVAILNDLERRLARRVTVGAIYATLDRLQDKGLLKSWMGEATAERGGRAKKFFSLTALGVKALEAARQRANDLWSGITAPIGKPA